MGIRTGNVWASYPDADSYLTEEKIENIETAIDNSATKAQGIKADTALQDVVAGTNVSIDRTDPARPVISAEGGASTAAVWGGITGNMADQTDLFGALAGKTSQGHTHPIDKIVGLETALGEKSDVGHTHTVGQISGLATDLANKAPLVHTHSTSDVTGLDTILNGKAPLSHTHSESEITGLETSLNDKSDVGHTHSTSDVTGLGTALAGKSDTNHTHTVGQVSGLSTQLGNKADAVHTHAQGDVTGLTAALDGKANTTHAHAQGDVTGLITALDDKAPLTHTHAQADVTGLVATLAAKANSTHTHAQADVTGLSTALAAKAALASPTFTGDPKVPTAVVNDNDTTIANTAFVRAQIGSEAVTKGLVDVKGDLIVATANDVPARLAVGTDGQVLTADSSAASGVKWAPAAGGSVVAISPKVGQYASPAFILANANNYGPASSGAVQGSPLYVYKTMSIDTLYLRVGTPEASCSARVLLYSSDADGAPLTLVANSGTLLADGAGFRGGTITPLVLPPGIYWGFIRTNSPGGAVRFFCGNLTSLNPVAYSDSITGPTDRAFTYKADVGTFVAPAATITPVLEVPGNVGSPWFSVRRSA